MLIRDPRLRPRDGCRRYCVLALFIRLDRPAKRDGAHARQPVLDGGSVCEPVLGIREDDIAFSAAKLFFAYGLGNALTFPLSWAPPRS
jgi:hypothetical protein